MLQITSSAVSNNNDTNIKAKNIAYHKNNEIVLKSYEIRSEGI